MVRSKEKTILNEVKPSAYFYIQEDRRQANNTIHEIHVIEKDESITVYKKPKDIRKVIYEHHKKLYGKNKTWDNAKEYMSSTYIFNNI